MNNEFFVGSRGTPETAGQKVFMVRPVVGEITRDQALNLAAWIVAVADPEGEDFRKLLEEVKST